ncbi:MAG: Leucine--tRNA ligase subunit alpha [Parcubacteria bacterium OLB19]|nr:MAG: Leucine--tRNA ligase subunit alpha [Parcubacteria bacterium OLB19]
MHKKFDSSEIEKKWQQIWEEEGIYNVGERDASKEKEYVLVEWPYPSGNLHLGHWYAFAVPDIYVRFKRMNGKQVLFPMGFDAFGLPAENAAIKHKIDPKAWTKQNIAHMRNQLDSMGNAFSWDKTTSSIDPEYYKWTQWMFTQFFEKGIAYRGKGMVNWCEGCHTVIANEQVTAENTCERCGTEIQKKEMPQWMLKITDYADRLIDDLTLVDWPEHVKEAQRQWIGRSSGAEIDFTLTTGEKITVFTTRPETLYGATYLVLAPEHALVTQNKNQIQNWSEVENYINITKQKADQDRLDNTKEKTGVKLEGITATNPASGEEIPVYIADYVLGGYGTGAIMAVPAHDERDFAFAKKFGLLVKQVVAKFIVHDGIHAPRPELETLEREVVDLIIEHPTDGTFLIQKEIDGDHTHVHFVGGGTDGESDEIAIVRELEEETGFTDFEVVKHIINIHGHGYRHTKNKNVIGKSAFYYIKLTSLNQKPSEIDEGKHTIEWLDKDEMLKHLNWDKHINAWKAFLNGDYHSEAGKLINSAEFNGMDSEVAKEAIVKKVGGKMTSTYRLRDWSIGRQRYWGVPIPIVYDPEGKAHIVPKDHLPWLLPEDVDFTPTGVAPLSKSEILKKCTEEIFGAGWTPEVETMDTFVDSSWYFLRYIDNKNNESLSSLEKQKDWMPIDIYFGGAEHTTMHLLYSRFWQKALFDLGLVTETEPYKRRVNRGLILGPDGNKMSKSKGNVIDPDEQVARVGADTVKMYLAFMGPYEGTNYPFDLGGIAGIRRFLERVNGLSEHIVAEEKKEITRLLHKTIKKVREDIKQFKFNTAISTMMVFVNQVEREGLSLDSYITFLRMIAPFAPHLAEELWHEQGNKESIHVMNYPEVDEDLAKDDMVTIGVQINGKLRGTIALAPDADEDLAKEAVSTNADLQKYLSSGEVVKFIYVPGRIVNIVLK